MKRMISLVMLVSISCASPARHSYEDRSRPHNFSGGEWNGLTFGMTKNDARLRLGKPFKVNQDAESGDEFWFYEQCGYVTFSDGKVSRWYAPNEMLASILRPG